MITENHAVIPLTTKTRQASNSIISLATQPWRMASLLLSFGAALLAGCSGASAPQDNTGEQPSTELPPLQLTNLQLNAIRNIEEFAAEKSKLDQAETLAKKAMEDVLFDPGSATFTGLRLGTDGGVCGKVNAKNRYGAYVGYKDFVLDKVGDVYISRFNDGIGSETYTDFAVTFLSQCATKQEKADYAQRLAPMQSYRDEGSPAYQEPDEVLDAPVDDERKRTPTT